MSDEADADPMTIGAVAGGLLAGFFVGKGLVPVIMKSLGDMVEYSTVPANPLIFIGAAIFSLVTVFISTGHPARMAARVSPIEALRYTEGSKARKKGKHSLSRGRIWRMALSNLGRSKGKTTIIIASLSLAIILLNSVFTITHSFDMDKYLQIFMKPDFIIGNAKYFGRDNYRGRNLETIDEENLTESFIE